MKIRSVVHTFKLKCCLRVMSINNYNEMDKMSILTRLKMIDLFVCCLVEWRQWHFIDGILQGGCILLYNHDTDDFHKYCWARSFVFLIKPINDGGHFYSFSILMNFISQLMNYRCLSVNWIKPDKRYCQLRKPFETHNINNLVVLLF